MATTMIALSHLAKQFGEQAVLKDINLTVNGGEIVGLMAHPVLVNQPLLRLHWGWKSLVVAMLRC